MSKAVLFAATLAGCTAGSTTRTPPGRLTDNAAAAAAGQDARLAHTSTDGRPSAASPRPALAERSRVASAWRTAYDWDGDGVKDRVVTEFTGGAHCCYRIGVELAGRSKAIMLPFRLDGGYVHPEDLPSKPERFSIVTVAGRLPEIVMEIETYNGRPARLDPSWARVYGVTTHRIAVSFPGGRVHVRNVAREVGKAVGPPR